MKVTLKMLRKYSFLKLAIASFFGLAALLHQANAAPPPNLKNEGYGSPSTIGLNVQIVTDAPSVGICRVKPWQNPNGGYEAGRWDPNTDGGACHYGWGGLDAWSGGPTVQFLHVSEHYRWERWDGSNHLGAVGSEDGTPHCEVYQDFGGERWWAGKISFGDGDKRAECHIPAGGVEHNYYPGSSGAGEIRVLRDDRGDH